MTYALHFLYSLLVVIVCKKKTQVRGLLGCVCRYFVLQVSCSLHQFIFSSSHKKDWLRFRSPLINWYPFPFFQFLERLVDAPESLFIQEEF